MEEEKTVGNPYWNKMHKLEERLNALERKIDILIKSMGRR